MTDKELFILCPQSNIKMVTAAKKLKALCTESTPSIQCRGVWEPTEYNKLLKMDGRELNHFLEPHLMACDVVVVFIDENSDLEANYIRTALLSSYQQWKGIMGIKIETTLPNNHVFRELSVRNSEAEILYFYQLFDIHYLNAETREIPIHEWIEHAIIDAQCRY